MRYWGGCFRKETSAKAKLNLIALKINTQKQAAQGGRASTKNRYSKEWRFCATILLIMFKKRITKKLEKYVRKYFTAHPDVRLVVVAGSVGKTSTKRAIATLLNEKYRVRLHQGNHNTHISAPLAILGIDYPGNIRSIWQWRKIFKAARKRIKSPSESEPQVIIQELGTDKPGDIEQFAKYLLPDIAVVTAVTPEHMEFFKTLSAVAREELSAANFSKIAIINRDDISGEFSNYITNYNLFTYGSTSAAEYNYEIDNYTPETGYQGKLNTVEFGQIPANLNVIGEHSIRPIIAASAVAIKLGLSAEEISRGALKIEPVPGRMNVLPGIKDSVIIDDSYNSSPAAAQAALEALYQIQSPSRVAVLGDMNELGESSAEEHQKLGQMCDPLSLSWVITVGKESAQYLAPAARQKGCQVKICRNALEAGAFANKVLEQGSVVLFKGSQGGVFLEEAVKVVLRSTLDEENLVRQEQSWIESKREFFNSFSKFIEEDV